MSWLWRGAQSALFHYLSCAPCTGYMHRSERRKQAKKDRKARRQLEMEQPELYRHPEPSATNPYWGEEIAMGPGPPPRRGKKTNAVMARPITTSGTQSTVVSRGGSSMDIYQTPSPLDMSDDTLTTDNWKRQRYQREDEDLWGANEHPGLQPTVTGSSVGVLGVSGPTTSKSSGESFFTTRIRAPPVNDLHPPVVSLPSPHPADNRWMLQPPPRPSIMSGKEMASNRSRSDSGTSSRVEVSLQRQVSRIQLQAKLERGETPEMPPSSIGISPRTLQDVMSDKHRTPRARPPSAASSKRRKRRDTAMASNVEMGNGIFSGGSSDTIVAPTMPTPPPAVATRDTQLVYVRKSRQRLSTLVSSDSTSPNAPFIRALAMERTSSQPEQVPPVTHRRKSQFSSTETPSLDSTLYLPKRHGTVVPSDDASLHVLQDLVSPSALVNSRFASPPLLEARIRLPPADAEEENTLSSAEAAWVSGGFDISGEWEADEVFVRAVSVRDPRMRWSVDF